MTGPRPGRRERAGSPPEAPPAAPPSPLPARLAGTLAEPEAPGAPAYAPASWQHVPTIRDPFGDPAEYATVHVPSVRAVVTVGAWVALVMSDGSSVRAASPLPPVVAAMLAGRPTIAV